MKQGKVKKLPRELERHVASGEAENIPRTHLRLLTIRGQLLCIGFLQVHLILDPKNPVMKQGQQNTHKPAESIHKLHYFPHTNIIHTNN